MVDPQAILETAREASRAGVCVLPTRADGSKAPDVASWKVYQSRLPTVEEHREWSWASRSGLGVVAGAVSGVEVWDFDDADTFEAFVARAGAVGLGDVVARLRAGYEDETPRRGRRWIVRVPAGVEVRDRTLARCQDGRTVRTLIELPTYSIIAPSNGATHPSGLPYVRRSGSLAQLPAYTADERDALLDLARSFDAMPARLAAPDTPVPRAGDAQAGRPGDAYAAEVTWREVLEPHGWEPVFSRGDTTHWRRPGKRLGVSATTNHGGSDLLWVFSSSTAFEPETSYSKFAAYAVLVHGGDYAAAARALGEQGYGAPLVREPRRPERRTAAAPAAPTTTETAQAAVVRLADVTPAAVQWLWPSRLAYGALALWVGDGGWGKSRASHDLAARVSRGEPWPDGAPGAAPADVVLLSAEDALDYTLRPSVEIAGGDLARVHVLTAVTEGEGRERTFSLERDLRLLEDVVARTQAALVIVDPVSAYFGTHLDSNRDTDVRSVLAPLVRVAERRRVAVLGIMHVGKSSERQARHRVLGSVGFVNAARLVAAVGPDPDAPERRLVSMFKSNLCKEAPTLAFRLVSAPGALAPRVAWEAQHEQVDSEVVLNGRPKLPEDAEVKDADAVLAELLASESWPLRASDVEAAARAHGLHIRSLQRAAKKVGVRIAKSGFRGGWMWYAPPREDDTPDGTSRTPHEDDSQTVAIQPQHAHGVCVSSSDATTPKTPMFCEDDTKTTRTSVCRLGGRVGGHEDDMTPSVSSSSSSQKSHVLHEDDTPLRRRHAASTRAREGAGVPDWVTTDLPAPEPGSSDAALAAREDDDAPF